MGLLFGEYVIRLELKDQARLPAYKGSTFRGVFGKALKRVVCALKRQDCGECLLRKKCIYFQVFENTNNRETLDKAAFIHPFIIEPPQENRTNYEKGEFLKCKLLLFGWANEYLPYFIYAFNEMGYLGIGKRIEGKRGAFELTDVISSHGKVYDKKSRELRTDLTTDLILPDFANYSSKCSALEITLKTPLRLKTRNRYAIDLDFETLVRASLRRVSTLNSYFGDGEPNLDYKGMVARAKSVKIANSSIEWFDWKRYSNRQNDSMMMGGLLGRIRFQGELSEFMPLLRYCEKVHLGKGTTFGLGKIGLRFDDREFISAQ